MAKEGISQVEVWGTREFGGVKLGDIRRTQRLVQIAVGLAECVGRAISSSCGKSGAQAVSRLFERKEVDVDSVLSEHKRQTRNRCIDSGGWIFAAQDTTTLDFSGHDDTEGLGPISTAKGGRGLLMHTTLLMTEDKTTLGIAGTQIWARKEEEHGKAQQRRKLLVCEKESNKWLQGLKDAESVVPVGQNLLVIGDRESDVFALFAAPRRETTHLLVRACHDRALEDEEYVYLNDAIQGAPIKGGYLLDVPKQGKRAARTAKLEVKAKEIVVKPPRHKTADIADIPVKLWLVIARELDAPDGVEPLEWILLSTVPVLSLADALWLLKAYASRWVIEEFHYTLKSGCEVEEMRFETVERLAPAIAVSAVVAWRILYLSKLSREKPDTPVLVVATESEIDVLERWLVAKNEKLTQVQTVQDFVLAVAYLGGWMTRKKGANPGVKTLWEGLRRLEDLLIGYRLATGQEIR